MRRIKRTQRFKQDYRRVLATPRYAKIETVLSAIVELLARDHSLPAEKLDHPLIGDRAGLRGCHVHSDLVLIYTKSGSDLLILNRLGSHSELFGQTSGPLG
jgi:mRNA interferase YafQ